MSANTNTIFHFGEVRILTFPLHDIKAQIRLKEKRNYGIVNDENAIMEVFYEYTTIRKFSFSS